MPPMQTGGQGMTAKNYTCRHCKQVLSIDLDKDDAFKVGFDHAWNNHAHTIAAAIERPRGIKERDDSKDCPARDLAPHVGNPCAACGSVETEMCKLHGWADCDCRRAIEEAKQDA